MITPHTAVMPAHPAPLELPPGDTKPFDACGRDIMTCVGGPEGGYELHMYVRVHVCECVCVCVWLGG